MQKLIIPNKPALNKGFSLVEMAVVLVILGFVLAALMLPLQAQRGQLQRTETENTLEIARKALIGYAQTNGRLPCPATITGSLPLVFPDGSPVSNPIAGGTCIQQLGFLPAATLGIQPTDAQGFAIDGWNNRIMYAVAQNSAVTVPANPATPDFTSNIADVPTTPANEADGMNVVGIANLTPELRVCNSATGITLTTCSVSVTPETNYSINNAVAVIYSLGATGSLASGGTEEDTNPRVSTNVKSVFVSHGITVASPTTQEFDHVVTWISPFVLYNAMIEAGQLH